MRARGNGTRPPHRGEEAILDRLSESVLAELESRPPPLSGSDDPDGGERFVAFAVGFLGERSDRAELIERVKAAVIGPSPEPEPGADDPAKPGGDPGDASGEDSQDPGD
jgi:hypothetical protein